MSDTIMEGFIAVWVLLSWGLDCNWIKSSGKWLDRSAHCFCFCVDLCKGNMQEVHKSNMRLLFHHVNILYSNTPGLSVTIRSPRCYSLCSSHIGKHNFISRIHKKTLWLSINEEMLLTDCFFSYFHYCSVNSKVLWSAGRRVSQQTYLSQGPYIYMWVLIESEMPLSVV